MGVGRVPLCGLNRDVAERAGRAMLKDHSRPHRTMIAVARYILLLNDRNALGRPQTVIATRRLTRLRTIDTATTKVTQRI